jgi:hypothetical protein
MAFHRTYSSPQTPESPSQKRSRNEFYNRYRTRKAIVRVESSRFIIRSRDRLTSTPKRSANACEALRRNVTRRIDKPRIDRGIDTSKPNKVIRSKSIEYPRKESLLSGIATFVCCEIFTFRLRLTLIRVYICALSLSLSLYTYIFHTFTNKLSA